MAESDTELGVESDCVAEEEPPSQLASDLNGATQQLQTPEELVARAIAPIKREFLRPPPSRTTQNNASSDADSKPSQSSLVKDKKSKRQLKRERRQVPYHNHTILNAFVLVLSAKFQWFLF
ncbi:hypothetical protein SLEP1_g33739 [Rubroshorea leprosula]|uniref:Uncharacterized protein n=1 Tax=Rubroshorea leprosula TaxID=152421 RepID=A0AAV5KHM4_9ROSI|nr:hypothetical protein SLEP1_g33739 [Rubroshorea leprosula]